MSIITELNNNNNNNNGSLQPESEKAKKVVPNFWWELLKMTFASFI